MRIKSLLPQLAVLTIFLLWQPKVSADTAAATRTVEKLQQSLLSSMQAGSSWNYATRFQKLAPTVDTAYHFPTISKVVLGSEWKALSPQQGEAFVDAFTALAVAQMADQFDSFSGQSFAVVESKPISRGQIMVRTVLRGKSGKEVPMDYVLARLGGNWRVINVVVDGVSDLAVKRAEYQRTIKSKGYENLLAEIREKIDRYGGWPGK